MADANNSSKNLIPKKDLLDYYNQGVRIFWPEYFYSKSLVDTLPKQETWTEKSISRDKFLTDLIKLVNQHADKTERIKEDDIQGAINQLNKWEKESRQKETKEKVEPTTPPIPEIKEEEPLENIEEEVPLEMEQIKKMEEDKRKERKQKVIPNKPPLPPKETITEVKEADDMERQLFIQVVGETPKDPKKKSSEEVEQLLNDAKTLNFSEFYIKYHNNIPIQYDDEVYAPTDKEIAKGFKSIWENLSGDDPSEKVANAFLSGPEYGFEILNAPTTPDALSFDTKPDKDVDKIFDSIGEIGLKFSFDKGGATNLSSRLLTSSLKFTGDLGGEFLGTDSPELATAFQIASHGGSSQMGKLVGDASKSGYSDLQVKHLRSLNRTVQALEDSLPWLKSIYNSDGKVRTISFANVNQADLILKPSYRSYVQKSSRVVMGPVKMLLKKTVGKAASKTLGKALAPAKKAVVQAAGKVVGKVVTKLGAKAAGAAIGSAVPGIGTAVGFVIGLVIDLAIGFVMKLASGLLKKLRSKDSSGIIIVLSTMLVLAAGAFIAPVFFILLVPIIFITAGMLMTGATVVGSGLGGIFTAFTAGFVVLVAGPVATILIAFFIIIPITLALILYIVTAGAYIVPPSVGGLDGLAPGAVTSPWIGVTKDAVPTGPFENSDLDLEITYNVKVWAKKSSLTNIRYNNKCTLRTEAGISPCPDQHPVPTEDECPGSLTPGGDACEFSYTVTYDERYKDALVIDSFEVVADASDKPDAFASDVAVVKIGDPPEDCPNGWPLGPEGAESSLAISQGPHGSFSHIGYEAIDIIAGTGHTITARHSGTVIASIDSTTGYGKHVIVQSICEGVTFSSLYAHMDARSVSTGTEITLGQILGASGDTGKSTGPHIHYEFRGITMHPQCVQTSNPLQCIPKAIPVGCLGGSSCGAIP